MFGIASNNEEEVVVTSNPTTTSGRPAKFDGPLTVTQTAGDATFTQDPASPNEVVFKSGDNPGTSNFLLEGDTDLGAGRTTISEEVVYEVAGANAANFGFSSTVRPKT